MRRFLFLALAASAGPAFAQVQFFPLDEAGFRAATPSLPTSYNFDNYGAWASIDQLASGADISLVNFEGGLVGDHGRAFFSGAFNQPGRVFQAALHPSTQGGQYGWVRVDFDPPVMSFGGWTYDDGSGIRNATRLRLIDTDGVEHVSPIIDANPGTAHGIDGFVGGVACRGIVAAVFEDFDVNSGVYTNTTGMERDYLQVGPVVPSISPPVVNACAGGSVTLTVAGVPSSSVVRWLKDGVEIPGAAGGSLTLSPLFAHDAGSYTCEVLDGEGVCGTDLTAPARVLICGADFNCDGGVDGDDVIAFFALWDAGESGADFTGDGGVDGDDVIGFFGRWDSGC
jgi:hypothetical protein